MADLNTFICPQCGAHLPVDPDETLVVCEYCGARSERSRPRAGDHGGPAATESATSLPSSPAARATAVVLVALGLMLGMWLLGFRTSGPGTPAPPPAPATPTDQAPTEPEEARRYFFASQPGILTDVDENGDNDLVVLLVHSDSPEIDKPISLAAVDGPTGELIWETPPLQGGLKDRAATLNGDVLLVGDPAGRLHALSVRDGRKRWSAPMGERIGLICGRGAAAVRVTTADLVVTDVTLATGALTPTDVVAPGPTPMTIGLGRLQRRDWELRLKCELLQATDSSVTPQAVAVGAGRYDAPLHGVRASEHLWPRGEDLAFVVGCGEPGTCVPTVAAVRPSTGGPGELLWRSRIPAGDAITLESQGAARSAWADGTLYVGYSIRPEELEARLAALDGKTGEVLWDVQVEDGDTYLSGLTADGERVFLSYVRETVAFDAETGRHLWTNDG